jgi:hypothetical protein
MATPYVDFSDSARAKPGGQNLTAKHFHGLKPAFVFRTPGRLIRPPNPKKGKMLVLFQYWGIVLLSPSMAILLSQAPKGSFRPCNGIRRAKRITLKLQLD